MVRYIRLYDTIIRLSCEMFTDFAGMEIGSHDTVPRNIATTRGNVTLFRCSRSNLSDTFSILWRYYSADDPKTPIDIYNGHNFLNRTRGSFRLNETESGQYDLIINSTILDDAGTYQCARSLDKEYPAELIVLGKPTIIVDMKI